jgi:hypothetical protein
MKKQFFSIVPHLVTDTSDAIEQALYLQMKSYAGEKPGGECFVSDRTLMRKLHVGNKALRKARETLLRRKWIYPMGTRITATPGGPQKTRCYGIVLIWEENNQYSKSKQGASKGRPLSVKGVSQKPIRYAPARHKEEPYINKKLNQPTEPQVSAEENERVTQKMKKFMESLPQKTKPTK